MCFGAVQKILFCGLHNGVCIPTPKRNKVCFFLSQYPVSSCMVYGAPSVVKQFIVYALWVFRDLITFFFGPPVVCPLRCKKKKIRQLLEQYESNQTVQLFKWFCYTATTFYRNITAEIKFHLCLFINFIPTGRSQSVGWLKYRSVIPVGL
jgi:hypothetical protein